jgi:hypothetical protein
LMHVLDETLLKSSVIWVTDKFSILQHVSLWVVKG